MSIFSRFFKSGPEQLSLSQAKALFSELEQKKKSEISKDSERLWGEFHAQLEGMKSALDKLENAKLINENIPARERNIMEGNRRAYVHHVRLLLHWFSTRGESEIIGSYVEKLGTFLKGTYKSYQILTHFYETEVNEAAQQLKGIEGTLKEISRLEARLLGVSQCRALFDELNSAVNASRLKRKRIREHTEQLTELDRRIVQKQRELEREKGSKECKELEALRQKSRTMAERKANLQRELIQLLLQFSKLLRKYHNLMGDKLSLALLEEPLRTLRASTREAMVLFTKLADLVVQEQISVKPNEKQKLLKRLDGLNVASIEKKLEELARLERELDKLKGRLKNASVLEHINRLKEEHRALVSERERVASELKRLKAESFDMSQLKQRLSSSLSKLSGRRIVLI